MLSRDRGQRGQRDHVAVVVADFAAGGCRRGCMRKGMSAWALTCQVRPNWLKSLTYSPPSSTCRASKTSVKGTPIILHLVRSISTYNCGVLARKTVDQADQAAVRCSLPCCMRLSVCACRAAGPSLLRSSIMTRKPPAVARPRTGGGPKHDRHASSTSSESRRWSVATIASAVSCRLAALVERLEHDEHRAQVRTVGAQHERQAGDADRMGDAFGCADDVVGVGHRRVGPLQRGRVGKLDRHEQIALVLVGNEADRHFAEAPAGQIQQAAVDQQHQEAHAQQLARPPRGIRRSRAKSRG